MRGTSTPAIVFLTVIGLATFIALVTSISSLAMPASSAGHTPPMQEVTPMAAGAGESQPGSTDGIVWMGVVITAIVLLPLLANRYFWRNPG